MQDILNIILNDTFLEKEMASIEKDFGNTGNAYSPLIGLHYESHICLKLGSRHISWYKSNFLQLLIL